jgi:hypothetical protein
MIVTKVLVLRSVKDSEIDKIKTEFNEKNYAIWYINAFQLPGSMRKELTDPEINTSSLIYCYFYKSIDKLDANSRWYIRTYDYSKWYDREAARCATFLALLIPPEETGLNERLRCAIELHKPDILLVHTGIVFHRFPAEMINLLTYFKSENSNLKISVQGGIAEVKKLLKENSIDTSMFEAGLNGDLFDSSKEIDQLLKRFI